VVCRLTVSGASMVPPVPDSTGASVAVPVDVTLFVRLPARAFHLHVGHPPIAAWVVNLCAPLSADAAPSITWFVVAPPGRLPA
jgi:hypothetical protein